MSCKSIDLEEGSAGIMCFTEPADHVCNEKDTIYFFSDGDNMTLFAKAKKEKINLQMCDEDKLYFLSEKQIEHHGASAACSICGRTVMDSMSKYYP